MILSTDRLLLRRWTEADIAPFAELNADKNVMEFFANTLSTEQTISMIEKIEEEFTNKAFGLWAAELRETGVFIGFIGLHAATFDAHFTPCVEIGWRLAKNYWGQGLAVEGAKEVIKDGFKRIGLAEIVSFTASINTRSIKVMKKIGMIRKQEDDFSHPALEEHHPLKSHVLYRLVKADWLILK